MAKTTDVTTETAPAPPTTKETAAARKASLEAQMDALHAELSSPDRTRSDAKIQADIDTAIRLNNVVRREFPDVF